MQARAFPQIRTGAAAAAHLSSSPVSRLCFHPSHCKSRLGAAPSISRGLFLPNRAICRVFSASATMDRTIRMPTRVVEHIVLLKVKEGASTEQQDAMVSALRSLKCLQTVIELSAGKVVHAMSAAYTHALHCRYMSKEDLESYANDPFHLDVISKYIAPIVEDRLALDWEADLEDPVLQSASYGAVRIVVMKPKQDLATAELSNIMDMLKENKNRFPFIKQVSVGKNFAPARAKGYEWAYLAVFPSPKELAELPKNEEYVSMELKVLPGMEKIGFVDYVTA
eukprot:c3654_g1_i1 orf=273-1115(-)